MQILKIYEPHEAVRELSDEEMRLGITILNESMGLMPRESLLIVTDPHMLKKEASLWFEAGKTITQKTHMVVYEGMSQHAQEPPSIVTLMMSKSNVIMLQTTYSLSHTKARLLTTKAGGRVASLPTVTHDLMMRTLKTDYSQLAQLTTTLAKQLTDASVARVTTSNGTDIRFDIKGRAGIDDTGIYRKRGAFGNLPAGEAFIAPVEGTSNGIYVVDGSFDAIELDEPITITIKDGMAIAITGGAAAKALCKKMADINNPLVYSIAELGIGTNKMANPRGDLIEAEKAYGTVHIALGNNATIGGVVAVPFHSDGVLLKPTLYLDESVVIDNGVFQ